MASLTTERLKEMEAEMNRFEQEILGPGMGPKGGPPRMIIGANTFSKVQAQLSGDPHSGPRPHPGPHMGPHMGSHSGPHPGPHPGPPPGRLPGPHPGPPSRDSDPSIPLSVLSAPPPPPPQASQESRDSSSSQSNPSLFLPPPPPPPLPTLPTPSFVPPQLRQRAPGPPLNRPPLPNRPPGPPGPYGPPPMMRGPMPGPMRHPMGPGPYGYHGSGAPPRPPSGGGPISIEKPKVVYSAPPVRKVPKGDGHNESSSGSMEIGVAVPGSEDGSHQEMEDAAAVQMMMPGLGEFVEHEPDVMQGTKKEKKEKKKKFVRTAAGTTWEDPTLAEWDTDDFRMFCGDLGNEVTDEHLARAFSKYPTFQKAKVVRDRRTNKTKGYGFVSFKDPNDFSRAMREMNGKYVGNRPIKLRKSSWKDRQIDVVRKKEKEKKKLGLR